jgi:prephenate dehydrogenase
MSPKAVLIIGVGLIGGSVAAAARRAHPSLRLLGASPATDHAAARELGLDMEMHETWESAVEALVAEADPTEALIVVATPPSVALALLPKVAAASQALLTDVCSVKQPLVELAADLAAAERFVPGHPLAGSHEQGASYAAADLFVGKPVVLTPTQFSSAEVIERTAEFWRSLGARVMTMSGEAHDRAVSRASHAVHVLAAVAAGLIEGDEAARELASSGYEDTTRIAAGDAEMWTQILLLNAGEIGCVLDAASERLDRLRAVLHGGDAEALRELLDRAQRARAAWRQARATTR